MNNALDIIKKLEHGLDDYETRNLIIDKINELIYVFNQHNGIIKEIVNSKNINTTRYDNKIEIDIVDVTDCESKFIRKCF